MGQWDDMIAKREADAEYFRDTIMKIESESLETRHLDDSGWRVTTEEYLARTKQHLADALAQVERLKAKNNA